MVSDEQIRELVERLATLGRCLNIEQRRIDLSNEEEKTQEPDFWEHPDRAREQLKKVASIKAWVEEYDHIAKQIEEQMLSAARDLDFERAAKLRDQLLEMRGEAPQKNEVQKKRRKTRESTRHH